MSDRVKNTVLPQRWVPDVSRLLPRDPGVYRGPRLVVWVFAAFLGLIVVRSAIHLFAPDGGATAIATIDTSVEGGSNIIAIFGQWGAIQLLLALTMVVLAARYRGLVPFFLVVLTVEPVLRYVSGSLKPIETIGTAPGAALNDYAGILMLLFAYLALCPAARPSGHEENQGE